MSEGSNIAIALAIIFLIGGVIPLVVGSFYDTEDIEPSGMYGFIQDLFSPSITIDEIELPLGLTYDLELPNIPGWIFTKIAPDEVEDFIDDQIVGYYVFRTEYPTLADGIFIICLFLIVYAFVKALPTT